MKKVAFLVLALFASTSSAFGQSATVSQLVQSDELCDWGDTLTATWVGITVTGGPGGNFFTLDKYIEGTSGNLIGHDIDTYLTMVGAGVTHIIPANFDRDVTGVADVQNYDWNGWIDIKATGVAEPVYTKWDAYWMIE